MMGIKSACSVLLLVTAIAGCAPKTQTSAMNPGPVYSVGQTVASLGDPTVPGMWLRTTLVKTETVGTIRDVNTGRVATVELHPMKGSRNAGAQASRLAMLQLGVPLTALPRIEVYAAAATNDR